jgi:hypothetical protein
MMYLVTFNLSTRSTIQIDTSTKAASQPGAFLHSSSGNQRAAKCSAKAPIPHHPKAESTKVTNAAGRNHKANGPPSNCQAAR